MLVLVGGGGIGKTAIAAQFCEEVTERLQGRVRSYARRIISKWRSPLVFEKVRWAAVRLRPEADELVADLILSLTDSHVNLAATLDGRVEQLLTLLTESRYLLVVDNVESVLSSGKVEDRALREEYMHVLKRLLEVRHNSVILLTSRISLVDEGLATLSPALVELQVPDLSVESARALLHKIAADGRPATSILDDQLPRNPLLIELIAVFLKTHDSLPDDIAEIVRSGTAVAFRDIVTWHVDRMSVISRATAFQIALMASGADLPTLENLLWPRPSTSDLEQAVAAMTESLGLDNRNKSFCFHPVVSELLTELLLALCARELESQQFDILRQLRVASSSCSDADLRANRRQLCSPIGDALNRLPAGDLVYSRAILLAKNDESNLASNAITFLMEKMRVLKGYDFSDQTFRFVDFTASEIQSANFSNCDFIGCRFTVPHGAVLDVSWLLADRAVLGVDALGHALTWTGKSYQEVAFEQVSRSWLRALAPIGEQHVVVGGDDSELILLRARDLHVLDRKRAVDLYWIRTLAVWPTRDSLYSGSEDGTLRLWDVIDERIHLSGSWPLRRGAIRAVRALRDGSAVAACDKGTVAIVSPGESGVVYHKLGDLQVRCLDIRSDEQVVAAFADDVGIWLMDLVTGRIATKGVGSTGSLLTLSWMADGTAIVASGDDGVVWRWPVARTATSLSIDDPSVIASLPGRVVALKVANLEPNVVLSCEGETTYLTNLESQQVYPLSRGDARRIWTVSGSSNGTHLVSGGEDRLVRVWRRDNADSFEEIGNLLHGGRVWRARYSPNSRWICTGSDDNIVRVWDARDLSLRESWSGHRDWVLDVAPYITDSDEFVLSASNDQRVGLWRIGQGVVNWNHHHDARVLRLGLWTDGRAISSSSDETLALFDPFSGSVEFRGTLQGHRAWGLDVDAIHGEVATGGDDGRVCIWRPEAGTPSPVVLGELEGMVLEVKFCRGGDSLVAASLDSGGFTVFHREDGGWSAPRILKHPYRFRAIWELSFGQIVAAGADQVLAVFDIRDPRLIREVRIPRVYESTNFSNSHGLTSCQRVSLDALGGINAVL